MPTMPDDEIVSRLRNRWVHGRKAQGSDRWWLFDLRRDEFVVGHPVRREFVIRFLATRDPEVRRALAAIHEQQ